MTLADALEENGWWRTAFAEQSARVERLERRLAETTADGLRYAYDVSRREVVLTCRECGVTVGSWPAGTRCLPVDAARARHDREAHRDAPPRMPTLAVVEPIGALNGRIAAAIGANDD